MKDHEKRDIGVVVSTYAPVGSDSNDEWDLYFDQLSSYISKKHHNETNTIQGWVSVKEDPIGSFGILVFHMNLVNVFDHISLSIIAQ